MSGMNFEQAFQALDARVFAKTQMHLKDAEKFVLQGAWQNQTYEQMADASDYRYTPSYLKQDVGPKLWKRLTQALEEPVSKTNFRNAIERWLEQGAPIETTMRVDWGEATDITHFYGRTEDLHTLTHWIVEQRCRAIALLGVGGIGKTSLSVKLIESVKAHVAGVIWRSLRNLPRLDEVLTD